MSLLTLATAATAKRLALQMVMPNQTAAPIVVVEGIRAGILPSLERKVRKTSHKKQINNQNKRKCPLLCATQQTGGLRSRRRGT